MIKKVFKDGFIYTLAGIISGGVSFLLLPFFTAYFSIEEYGLYDYLIVFGTLINLTVALEISQGVARFIPENLENIKIKRLYASTSLWFTVFCFSFLFIIFYFFNDTVSVLLLDNSKYSKLLIISILSFSLYAIVYLIINQLKWELKSKQSSFVSLLYSVFSILSSIYFVCSLKLGVEGAFWGNALGGALASIVGLYFTRKSYSFIFSFSMLKEMLYFSVPLVLSGIAVFLSNFTDRLAIKKLMTLEDLGIYGVGFRISFIIYLAIIGFQGALTPLIYKNYKRPDTPKKIADIFRYFSIFSILLFAFLSLFSSELILILSNKTYHNAVNVIPLLILSVLFTRMYIFCPGIGIKKKTILAAFINIISASINILLNFLFIPYWGIIGAALATLISALFMFISFMFYGQKYYYIPFKFKNIIYFTVFVIACVFINNYLLLNFSYSLLFKILILLGIITGSYYFKIISKEELLNIKSLIMKEFNKIRM